MATLSAYYKFENNGTDDSGNGNDVTAGGTTAFSSSVKKKGAYSLDLTSAGEMHRNASITGITGGNHDRAMATYVYPTAASSGAYLMSLGTSTNSQQYVFLLDNSGTEHLGVQFYADDTSLATSTAMGTGAWIHLATSLNSATNTDTFWINGVSQGTAAHGGASNLVMGKLTIGDDPAQGHTSGAPGYYDESRFYDSQLSQADIDALLAVPATAGLTLLMTMLAKATGNFKLLNGLIIDPKNANPRKLLNYYSGMLKEFDPKRLEDIINWRERQIKAWEKKIAI